MANTITGVAKPVNSSLPIQMRLVGTSTWVDGVLQGDGTYLCTLPSVPAGTYAAGQVEYRLKGSNPVVNAFSTNTITVVDGAGSTTPLSAPANLRQTSSSSGAVSLAWDAVANASSYELQQAAVTGGVVGTYTTIYNDSALTTTNSGLSGGTYSYQVRARGTGAYTNSVYATPLQVAIGGGTPSGKKQFISDGDSKEGRGAGTGDPNDAGGFYSTLRWTKEMQNLLSPTAWGDFRNYGVSSQTLDAMLGDYQTEVLPLRDATTYPGGQFLFVGSGVNNAMYVSADDGAAIFAKRRQYIEGALAAGWTYVVTDTITGAYTSGAVSPADTAVKINTANALLRQYAAQNPTKICLFDFAADVLLDNTEDTTYRKDNIHFIEAGEKLKAQIGENALTAFVAGLPTPVAEKPSLSYSSSSQVLTVTSSYPASQLLLSVNGGIFRTLSSKSISVPTGTYAADYYRVAARVTSDYNCSAIAGSDMITPPAPTSKRYEQGDAGGTAIGSWAPSDNGSLDSAGMIYTTTVGDKYERVFTGPKIKQAQLFHGSYDSFHTFYDVYVTDGTGVRVLDGTKEIPQGQGNKDFGLQYTTQEYAAGIAKVEQVNKAFTIADVQVAIYA